VVYYLLAEEGSDPVISDVLGLKRQQLEPVRNPDAELVEKLQTDDDHIKRLAESYLKRHQRKLPPTDELPENVIPLVPTGVAACEPPPEDDPEPVVEPLPESDPEPELEGET
jgi:hypothetical protein